MKISKRTLGVFLLLFTVTLANAVPSKSELFTQKLQRDNISEKYRNMVHNPAPLPKGYKPILSKIPQRKVRAIANDFQITYVADGVTNTSETKT